MKMFEYSKNTTMRDALRRVGVDAPNRAAASAWSWRGSKGLVVSLHLDTPQPWRGASGSLHGADLLLPIDGETERDRTPVQESRHQVLLQMLIEAADNRMNIIVLAVNWKRDGDGRFTNEQLMYPHSAWQMGVQWADRDRRVVRIREAFDKDAVVCVDPSHCMDCGQVGVTEGHEGCPAAHD